MFGEIGTGLSDAFVLLGAVRVGFRAFRLIGAGSCVSGSDCVSESCVRFTHAVSHELVVGFAVVAVAGYETDDAVATRWVACHGHNVTVIGGHYDEGVAGVGVVVSGFDGFGEFHGVAQSSVGVASVVGVVDATAFDEKEKSFVVVIENIDGQFGHFGERGFFAFFFSKVGGELHVGAFEETE